MPYIKRDMKRALDMSLSQAGTPGELNYLLTSRCQSYLKEKGTSYQTINDILGALEGAKLEFVRRVVNPYEDSKIKENGDVYNGNS